MIHSRVQLETVRLDGVSPKNMSENVIEMALKLSEEMGHLRKNNEILKMEVKTV
jgi:hypothetical protein